MKILWTVIIIDCIITICFVGLLDVPEINPLISWMIPYIGLSGMIVVKLLFSYTMLNIIAKPLAVKHNINYNKTCHICACTYVITLIIFY